MTTEKIDALMSTRPFRAFRIHIADGRSLDVVSPEFLARSPGGRTLIVFHGDERFEILDLLLVTSLEVLNGKSRGARRRNGR